MIRISCSCLRSIGGLFRQKPTVIVYTRNYSRATTNISQYFIQKSFYSKENNVKNSTTPLSSLLSNKNLKESEQLEKLPEPGEEDEGKKREQSWKTMKYTLWGFGVTFTCIGIYLIVTLGAPNRNEEGAIIKDEFSDHMVIVQYIKRALRELDYYRNLIKEPSREKLLPDTLEYPYVQPKYTLVLELTDVLVHPDWTYKTGWRFMKRPMLDYFLDALKDKYEIVIYTAEQGMTVFPLVDAIDPKNIIAYKLVRDATHFTSGHHVKRLDKLNRDLSKLICIDWDPKSVKFNPENLLKVKRWTGNGNDTSLFDLASFLKIIAENDIEDVREVLKVYSKYDDPIAAFREKQQRLIDKLEEEAAAKREQEKSKLFRWTPSFFKKSY